jgi:intein-encoded DNA endonuclease-like protein
MEVKKGGLKKGHNWPEKIKKKMLNNLLETILLKPNLNMTENLYYIVGLLKGDGCVYKNGRSYRICFDNTNKNLSRNIFRALKEIGLNPTLYEVRPSNGINKLKQYRVVANSKLFYNWYKGLSAKKLREFLDTKEKIVSFIRGFYEAEGGIYKSKNGTISVAMYNTDLELLKLIKSLLEKLGLHFCLNGPYKNIKLGGPSARPIYRLITSSKKDVNTFLNLIKPSVKNLQ